METALMIFYIVAAVICVGCAVFAWWCNHH
jgi:hypothetical protein